jgi:hypothetical protein
MRVTVSVLATVVAVASAVSVAALAAPMRTGLPAYTDGYARHGDRQVDRRAGARGLARQVAVMRKARGRWRWVEYDLHGGHYGVLAKGSLWTSCHMQARANDWVCTKR